MYNLTRKRLHSIALSSLVFLLSIITLSPQTSSMAAAPSVQAGEKLVLAFHYMWYSAANFDGGQMSDRPVTPYLSTQQDVIDRQVSEAKSAGIDAFISAWTGTGTVIDQTWPKLLDSAAAHDFRTTIYFETDSVMQHGDVATQLQWVTSRFIGHKAFLRWNAKPVIFFWSPQSLGGPAAWRQVRQKVDPNNTQIWSVDTTDASYLDVFDTIHLFGGGKWAGNTNVAQVDAQWRSTIDNYNKAHSTSRLWTAGVVPGWDESRVVPPRDHAKVFPRLDGALYEENWRAAVSSNPEWITITSFNEWYEGSQIEPSVTYGRRYLDATAKLASSWKNGPSPCDGGTLYPQTGHAICKQMESYWQKYGGLAQFGYPISEPASEVSLTDGKSYTVQYFERSRFELHPENSDPAYQVQLGLLGRQFHKSDPAVAAINDGKHQFFRETGHNVSATFYAYWQQHGGLFVNGFPISEELREQGSDGKTYTVQYFERARYEMHPENAPPYNVLLGALGRQALEHR